MKGLGVGAKEEVGKEMHLETRRRGKMGILRREANYGHSTLFTSNAGLENAKQLVSAYKQGMIRDMNEELWTAKKIIDSTLHPGTAVYSGMQD